MRARQCAGVIAGVALMLSGVQVATGQNWCPGDGFPTFASDGEVGDYFGTSVGISGDTAIVGAYRDDDRGTDSGSAYVFERIDGIWTEVAKLTAPDGQTGDRFGVSVGISGDTAIVGAHRDDDQGTDAGAAYVFQRAGGIWFLLDKFTVSDGQRDNLFGLSVAISGDTVVVGAPYDDDLGASSGSAYVFERVGNAWTQVAKLTAADGQEGDVFGLSVAISGDTTIVGAYREDDRAPNAGSAYVFERVGNAWTQVAKLTAADGQGGDLFGVSVGISGDTAIVGSYGDDDLGTDAGTAYIFERIDGVWTQIRKLTASDGEAGDGFGVSVAIDGESAVVGAHQDDDQSPNSGSAYVFKRTNDAWVEVAKRFARDGQVGDAFASSVAISASRAVIGALGDDNLGSDSGSVYFMHNPASACCADIDENGVLDANDFFTFLDYFAAGDPRADFTGDGVIDAADFFAYLDIFAAGCP